jgi:Tfp pilus assembly protein PilO
MGERNADRLWLIGGAAVVAVLVIAGYLLLIGPKYTQAAEVQLQVQDTQTQLIKLRKKISDLQEQQKFLAKYTAARDTNRKALPTTAGVSDFLRQLQTAGDNVNVSVTGVSVAEPVKSTTVADVYELPMTLTADGTADNLSSFLTQLQSVQPRAVLVKSANLTQGNGTDVQPSLNLAITAYVSPPAGSGAPIVTSK